MSAHTPGPWLLGDENNACCEVECGQTRISLDRQDPFTGAYVISRDEMLANAYLVKGAPDLLAALEAVPREVEIRREMDCVAARRPDPCGQGLFGIAVKTDPDALQWQALDAELEVLAKRRLDAIAKARGGR